MYNKFLMKPQYQKSFSLETGPQSFCYLFIALSSIIHCLKSAEKFAVWMDVSSCYTVATETTQLVLSRCLNILLMNNELNNIYQK